MNRLIYKPYPDQRDGWPEAGRVILAQYDDASVVVYQAYRKSIADAAVRQQQLGGDGSGFSFDRMSWIKTSFLWMMHRSGWASKQGQEHILAIWMERLAFDSLLSEAVHSQYLNEVYDSHEVWQSAVDSSDVLVQWDPDHMPNGMPTARRALQLGLRDDVLRRFATEWIIQIEDITQFVREQASFLQETGSDLLLLPRERVYPVTDQSVVVKLGLDRFK